MKKFLENHNTLLQWLSGLGIPFAILLCGWWVLGSNESAKLNSEYVRIALGLLSKPVEYKDGVAKAPTTEDLALKRWAIRLLDSKSPEAFRDDEKKVLLDSPEPLLLYPTYDSSYPYTYDALGNRVNPANGFFRSGPPPNAKLLEEKYDNGTRRVYQYDDHGRVTSMLETKPESKK